MTTSRALIPRPSWDSRYTSSLCDLTLVASPGIGTFAELYAYAQSMLDRNGGALSVQCHPSAVRAEESYTSNASEGATSEFWRQQCTGSWSIVTDGTAASDLPIAGACSEGPEIQPTAAALLSGCVYLSANELTGTIASERTIVHSDGTATTTATPDATLAVGEFKPAEEITAELLLPLQYAAILIGSGGFPVSCTDLVSQSLAATTALANARNSRWTMGGAVAAGNDYDPRTVTVDANIAAGSGVGTAFAYCGSCAISVARR